MPPGPATNAGTHASRWSPVWSHIWADLRLVLLPWLTARLLVGMAWVLSVTVVNRLQDQHILSVRPDQLGNGLVAWDGSWYRDLAIHGYRAVPVPGVRFFPLFPLIGRLLAVPIGGRVDLPLVIVANLCSLAAAVLVLRLVRFERGGDALALRSVWILMLFPAAFVLVLAYAEPLMMVMTVRRLPGPAPRSVVVGGPVGLPRRAQSSPGGARGRACRGRAGPGMAPDRDP